MECGYCWSEVTCSIPEIIREYNTVKLRSLCYCPQCKKAWYSIEKFTYDGWEKEVIREKENN